MTRATRCNICVQRKAALDELAEWLKSIREHGKEVEHSFLKNKRQGGDNYVSDMRMQSVREMR
jgi:hypothetical protein